MLTRATRTLPVQPVQNRNPYEGPIPVREQAKILKRNFPKIDDSHVDGLIERYSTGVFSEDGPYRGVVRRELVAPKGAEGWFAALKWKSLGIAFYDVAVATVVYAGGLGKDPNLPLRRRPDTADRLTDLGKEQEGDILIFPAQLGSRFRGMNLEPDEARLRFGPDEFGLDAFSVACMLLTHPSRLLDRRSTCIAVPGNAIYDKRYQWPTEPAMHRGGCLRFHTAFSEVQAFRRLTVSSDARGEMNYSEEDSHLRYTHADCATAFVPRPGQS